MPRRKVVGKEKCPHINKKSGISDCEKLGRYNPNPGVSWNNNRKFDKKREYQQFIHNDGTIHNLGKFRDFRLKQTKSNALQDFFKYLVDLQGHFYEVARKFEIIANRDLRKLKLDDSEIRDLMNGINYHNIMLVKWFRAVQLIDDSIDYILQNSRQPPEEMTIELRRIIKFLLVYNILLYNKIDPLIATLNEIYDKYVMPERRKKKKITNKRISDTKGGIPKSRSLPN